MRTSVRYDVGECVQILDGNRGFGIVIPWPSTWTPRSQMDTPEDTYAIVDDRGDLFSADASVLRRQPGCRVVRLTNDELFFIRHAIDMHNCGEQHDGPRYDELRRKLGG